MIFSAKFSNQEVSQVSDNFSPQIEMIAFESSVNGNNNCDTLLHLPYNIFIIVLVDMWKNLKEFKNVNFFLFIFYKI